MERLVKAEEARRKKRALDEEEKEALRPRLKNFEDIQMVKEWIDELTHKVENSHLWSTTDYRQRFLCIIIWLYCPGTLLGDSLLKGLREKLSDIMGISPSMVSHHISNLYFYYNEYKLFRSDIDFIIAEVLLRIEAE